MIGELTKGDCSMYGAWGKATASTGKTFQLRALDWDVDGPFKDYAAGVCPAAATAAASSGVPVGMWCLVGMIMAWEGVAHCGVAGAMAGRMCVRGGP
jgi:hypothetical protein